MDEIAKNTDKELWRRGKCKVYSPSIHVTKEGNIGINVGGSVFVMPVEVWHKLAENRKPALIVCKYCDNSIVNDDLEFVPSEDNLDCVNCNKGNNYVPQPV